jgi:K(+)-stimulated pyrophosphate-energized sodium pump
MLIFALIASIIALAFVIYFSSFIIKQNPGTPKMKKISDAIKEGSLAYLKRQYKTLAIFVAALTIILALVFSYSFAFAYLVGSIFSVLAGFIGMNVAIRANVRTANAARIGLSKALPIAFKGGAVMGLSVVGLGLLGIVLFYYLYGDPNLILGFSFGASSIALFARVGGGIYTKTADVGADLVGKIEKGIPEDDPRNPAVIADNVGDNVGDVAGMGADLFESYVGSIVAAMIIGTIIFGSNRIILPLLLAALGIFASLIGTFFVRVKKKGDPSFALNKGTFSSCILFALFAFILIQYLNVSIGIFYAVLAGLIAGIIIGLTSDYFTSREKKPARKIAESAKTGAAITILSGFSTGLLSVVLPIVGIAIATIIAWYFAGIFGIAIAAIGMLSITGMVVAADSYGPIVDNAGGIVEQSKLGEKVRRVTDSLDAVGNTTKAICKGFAIGSAALTALALFFTYSQVAGIKTIDIMNPYVIAGIFIGAAIPALFSALTISAVSKNAFRMVEEVRRQFREIPGLIKGKARPEYAKCVDIATKGALKELILPGFLAIIVPLVVGFLLGKEALAGLLAGSITTGLIFALLMGNAGASWDNAKKYIEAGNFGGKGSEAHKAAVVGDTVGDPLKDCSGPSMNILIKVMSIVSLVFAPLIVKYALI